MANEANLTLSLSINKPPLQYQSRPGQFRADVAVGKGPTPGAFTCVPAGTDADLSELDTPGLVRIQSLEETGGEPIEWGIWDGATFIGVGRLLPGELALFRLSSEFANGTTTNTLRFVPDANPAVVLVEAFES